MVRLKTVANRTLSPDIYSDGLRKCVEKLIDLDISVDRATGKTMAHFSIEPSNKNLKSIQRLAEQGKTIIRWADTPVRDPQPNMP